MRPHFPALAVLLIIASSSSQAEPQIRNSADSYQIWLNSRGSIERLPKPDQQAVVDLLYDQMEFARIIGGVDVEQADFAAKFPWMVALGVKRSNGEIRQFCGGSLISDRWVLTAAHCDAFPSPATFVTVSYGNPQFSMATRATIKRIVRHPNYVSANSGSDVALIELAQPISGAKPILLADQLPATGTSSEIIGWGITDAGVGSDRLQHGQVTVLDTNNCSEAYKLAPFTVTNWHTMVCAANTGIDSCQGDSGGPIAIGVGVNARQFGVVSFGEGCADIRFPGVYSSVPSLRDWIRSTSGV